MTDINAVSKAKSIDSKREIGEFKGFEQRHETGETHFHTSLLVGQTQLGFVSITVESEEFHRQRRSADGYLTLTPEQAKSLAAELTAHADEAQKDRDNPEFSPIEELPDSVLS
jgi:hypothetical protein